MSRALRIVLACASCLCGPAATGPAAAAPPTIATWSLCELVGPGAQRPGIYGTDLGFTFVHPYRDANDTVDDRLVFLFGDTWPDATSPCTEPPPQNDDVAATVRVADLPSYPAGPPPDGPGTARCPILDFGAAEPLRTRPLHVVFDDRDVEMGYGRTPLTGWSDGRRPHGLFSAGELATCATDADCGGGLGCAHGEFGRCAVSPCTEGGACPPDPGFDDVLIPSACRLDRASDCTVPWSPRRGCAEIPERRGVCTDATGSLWRTALAASASDPDPSSPSAREREPDRRHLLARWVYVAAESPERPGVYEAVARFATAKFINSAARTIAAFDPDDPSRNDYRHGYDTLLVWGRPWFLGAGGAQSLPYLLYVDLDAGPRGAAVWSPRYFAGHGEDGRPRWSENEADAAPLYESEFDLVNQLSVAWVEPLGAWVMLYGGDQPDAMKGGAGPRAHEQPEPGAVHLRWAAHPWGAATRDADGAWSDPVPVVRPEEVAPLLACEGNGVPAGCVEGDPIRPLDFFRARLTGADCRAGRPEGVFDRGNLYAANVLDVLTRAVPPSRPGGRAAELVWTVSTWNPYAVQLLKSRVELPPR